MRQPAVSGQFYSSDPKKLKEQIEGCFLHKLGPRALPSKGAYKGGISGAVVPHAGYMYSGPVAAHIYYELAKYGPRTFVIIGPNHTGKGSGVAVSMDDWKTPLGVARVDKNVAEGLMQACEIIDHNETAHEDEHSIEVQLPFLQYVFGDLKFVPICIALQDLDTAREIGRALSKMKDIVVLASSDFTHYESADDARPKDELAIKRILALDAKGFIEVVYQRDMSICGYGPIATCISAMEGKKQTGKLVKYATSGDITGDLSQVVAYAAISFS